MQEAYTALAHVIRSYEASRLDDDIVQSLRFMLSHDTFSPIHDVIEHKMVEIADFFRRDTKHKINKTSREKKPKDGPKNDSRKRKKKATNAADVPEGSTPGPTMVFEIRNGILVPV